MANCTIGIDVGSTTSKGVLYNVASQQVLHVVSDATRPIALGLPSGHYEESPEPLRRAAYAMLRDLAKYASENALSVRAICFTGQMHGGLLVDQQLRPLTNFVTWQDKRGDEKIGGTSIASIISQRVSNADREALGTDVHTGFLGVTYAWWKQQGPVQAGARIVGIYEWIASTLTGRVTSDRSSVAAWGLYDIRNHKVSAAYLDVCGLTNDQMPEVLDIGELIGAIDPDHARGLGLPSDTMIISGMGDTQASYIGSGSTAEDVLLNFGTGSQLMIESPIFGRYWGTDTRYLSENSYLIVAPTLAGGKAYSILADFFARVLREFGQELDKHSIYERMNELALTTIQDLTFTPYFLGSRTHGEQLRASISGLDPQNFTPASLVRSLLMGMIKEVSEPYDKLPAKLRSQTGIVASGNGMRRNPALRKFASESFGLPLRMPDFEEEAALGAAVVAARAIT